MKEINWFVLVAFLLSVALEYYGVWKNNDIGIFAGAILAITNLGILTND